MTPTNLHLMRWRTGRKVGRTIYAQTGSAASGRDPLIGTMDSPALARAAVDAHNDTLDAPLGSVAGRLAAELRTIAAATGRDPDGINDDPEKAGRIMRAQAAEITRLRALVADVAASGLTIDDSRLGYVEAQIDRGTWDAITRLPVEETARG